MGGDGRRDQGERPAVLVVYGMQIDGGAMKAHAEAEYGQHECAADDAPAVERPGL
jgi:hypothetical protein